MCRLQNIFQCPHLNLLSRNSCLSIIINNKKRHFTQASFFVLNFIDIILSLLHIYSLQEQYTFRILITKRSRFVDVTYFTSTPMLLAEPATIFIAASISLAFKSAIFFSAISLSCAFVRLPTFETVFLPEPFSLPRAFRIRFEAGGVFKTKENVLSSYTEISTGTKSPTILAVASLNCLTNSPIF